MVHLGLAVAEVVEEVVLGGGVRQVDVGQEQGLAPGVGLGQNLPSGVEGPALAAVVEPLFRAYIVAVEGVGSLPSVV